MIQLYKFFTTRTMMLATTLVTYWAQLNSIQLVASENEVPAPTFQDNSRTFPPKNQCEANSRPMVHNLSKYTSCYTCSQFFNQQQTFQRLPSTFNPLPWDTWLVLELNSKVFNVFLSFTQPRLVLIQGCFKTSLEFKGSIGCKVLQPSKNTRFFIHNDTSLVINTKPKLFYESGKK